jgi:hypothetical protein
MGTLRQISGSILLALFSISLVIGGISLALAESYVPDFPTPTETLALVSIFNTPTFQPQLQVTETISVPTETVPPPVSCPPPTGWIPITVQPGENLATLALRHHSSPENLLVANCLFSTDLTTGSIVYVPSIPTNTPIPCGPPAGWIRYTVQAGNTMYSLSQAYGVSITQLQFANCMLTNQYSLSTGQSLWVPNVATRTPRATATATLTPVSIIFPTITRTATVTPTASKVPTSTMTSTNVPTSTATATVASPTTPPTATATITAFPTSTATATPIP